MKWSRRSLACMLMMFMAFFPVGGMALTCPMMPAQQAEKVSPPCHEAEPETPAKQQSKACCGSFACQACASHVAAPPNPLSWRSVRSEEVRYTPVVSYFASHIPEYQDPPPKIN